MKNKRRDYSPAELISLTTQVNGVCPICGKSLFYEKHGKTHKAYEIAHIYPLNPKPAEISVLEKEKRLDSDVNNSNNLIPLCLSCHGKFDKPRTVEEYRDLVSKKEALIRSAEQQSIQLQYEIEKDIIRIIESLYSEDLENQEVELAYDPQTILAKIDETMTRPTRQKIRRNVSDYFNFIRKKLIELERDTPNTSDLISAQVKAYYLKQKSLGLSQQHIFSNIVQWLYLKTQPETIEGAEIVISFFVQNCEVFE